MSNPVALRLLRRRWRRDVSLRFRPFFLVLALVVDRAEVHAQQCRGSSELRPAVMRAEVNGTRFVYGRGLEASLTSRTPIPQTYFIGSVGAATDAELGAATGQLGFRFGAELPVTTLVSLRLCPTFGVAWQHGPDNLLFDGSTQRTLEFSGGLGVSAVGRVRGARVLVAAAGERAGLARLTRYPPSRAESPRTLWGSHFRLEAIVGLILDDMLSVQARLTRVSGIRAEQQVVPFARENEDIAVSLGLSYAFERKRSARQP